MRIGLKTVMGNDRTFLRKAFSILLLGLEKALGHEQWEVRIQVTGVFKHLVKGLLHLLPNAVTIGLNYHTSPHIRVLGQVSLFY